MKASDIREAYHLTQVLDIINKLEEILSGDSPPENVEFPIRVDERDVIPLIVPAQFVQECMLNPLKMSVIDTLAELGVEIKERVDESGSSSSVSSSL